MNDDRNAPATKGDLLDLRDDLRGEFKSDIGTLRTEFKSDIGALRDELKSNIGDLGDELVEAIHDSQTELLKAFYGLSQTVQNRFKESDESEATLKRRMTTIESRMLEIEKRLNLPPNAA